MSATLAPPLVQPPAATRSVPTAARVGTFFGLTFAWSWLLWGLLALSGLPPLAAPGVVLLLLGGFGPSLAAVVLVVRSASATERQDFWSRLIAVRRLSPGWAAVAVLLAPVITVIAVAADYATGGSAGNPAIMALQALARPAAVVGLVVQMLLGGALAEELGWRGYALDRLQARSSPLLASLGLGAVWAVWHAPLVFLRGTAQAEMGLASVGAVLFLVAIMAQSVLFTWVYNHIRRRILGAMVVLSRPRPDRWAIARGSTGRAS